MPTPTLAFLSQRCPADDPGADWTLQIHPFIDREADPQKPALLLHKNRITLFAWIVILFVDVLDELILYGQLRAAATAP